MVLLEKCVETCEKTSNFKALRHLGATPKPWVAGSSPPAPAKKSSFFGTRIFLSKPQAWYIIRRKSVYHQGRVAPLHIITRQRVFSCGLMRYNSCGIDDIQVFALMIYTASPRFLAPAPIPSSPLRDNNSVQYSIKKVSTF